MVYGENKQEIAATCGMVIDNEYILWASWENGSLYKFSLKDNHLEMVRGTLGIGCKGKTFSCMLKNNEKIYLISLFDCYEIAEYDMISNQLRLLYQQTQQGIYIFNAFLINGKIYIFPSQLDSSVCIYSISNNNADYIKWEKIFSDKKLDLKGKLLGSMDCIGQTLCGTILDSTYLFEIQTEPQIKCEVQILKNDYRMMSINAYGREKYITLMNDDKLICVKPDGEIEEFGLFHEETANDGIPFSCTVLYRDKIFLIPCIKNDRIQVVDRMTGEHNVLEYPDNFYRKADKCRLFWLPIVFENKAYLLPHTGSGLLVLDMCSCRIECFMGWKKGLKNFLDTICCSDVRREKNEMIDVGTVIYKFIKQSN